MTYLRSILVFAVVPFFAGCATIPKLVEEAVGFGHDALSGTSELVAGSVEGCFALLNQNVSVPTIPWRHEGKSRQTQTVRKSCVTSQDSSLYETSAKEYLKMAMCAYRNFDYQRAVAVSTDSLKAGRSASDKGNAYVWRGACFYLLNNTGRAKSDFAAAKRYSASMNSKIFPEDMIRFYNKSH